MRKPLLALMIFVAVLAGFVGTRNRALAANSLPPTTVTVHSGYVVVSTTAKTAGLDTSVYITGQTPGGNFIYHTAIPATITNDAGWNCPCTAQITYRAKSGTVKVLTARSAPFTPQP